jgi:hypothetical protein
VYRVIAVGVTVTAGLLVLMGVASWAEGRRFIGSGGLSKSG